MKKNDITVPSPCINVALGKCQVTKSPKINIELGKGGLYVLWRFLPFSQTFMARIVQKYMNFDFEYFHILKKDIFVPSPCINVQLFECQVTKSPKINTDLGEGGLYNLWRFLLFCQTFKARILQKYISFDFEDFNILQHLKRL